MLMQIGRNPGEFLRRGDMEECALSPGTMPGGLSDIAIGFDYIDELLLDGCWLETTVGSDFFHLSPSTSPLVDSSWLWPASDANCGGMLMTSSKKVPLEVETGSSLMPASTSLNDPRCRYPLSSRSCDQQAAMTNGREGNIVEGLDVNRRFWIGPEATGTSVMERLMTALRNIKQSIKQKDVLVQLWIPENRGGRRVLRTHNDLFALDPSSWKLATYREVSANYQFSAEEDAKDMAGLPGRVFLGKVPEWTPDVRFFKSNEYQRVNLAQQCEVSGTLALPVFEHGSRNCLGVIEVVTTEQKIKYRPELENVYKALEAVDLRSAEALSMQNLKASDGSYEAALPEIKELLRSACETHGLPLAQTWVLCGQQGKEGCRHSDENYDRCVSTVDQACHVADPAVRPFHEACSEHHLLKGQGVAGGAFLTNQPCFSSDITLFTKTQYPLAHYAKVFKMCAAVAIRMRSLHTGKADFVLEFFLPVDCVDPEEQRKMPTSLSDIIQKICQTLRVVTDKELEEESNASVNEVLITTDDGSLAEVESVADKLQKRTASMCQSEKPELRLNKKSKEHKNDRKQNTVDAKYGGISCSDVHKTGEKRPNKAENTISLEFLRQYFAGSLKEAARSIGVCPTTLKRMCRRHGIQRWPSRKIKKVGHSLQKIQHVIDSVQGASGGVQIGSFYKEFPALASPSKSRTSPFANANAIDLPMTSATQPVRGIISSQFGPPKSTSSSFTHGSSSSHSSSSGTHQHHSAFTFSANVDSVPNEPLGTGVLKRVRSDAEMQSSSQNAKRLMPRSQSHKSLVQQPNFGHSSQEDDSRRVKVTYGGENIRFRMPKSWGFGDLMQEIARRFNISDFSMLDVKYLDDDSEWVLLTCEDDLQECIDICQSSKSSTIRLMLRVSPATLRPSLEFHSLN